MLTAVASSIVSASALVAVAIITFFLNERGKRAASWRQSKLEYYSDFFDSLATNIEGYLSEESHRAFARETNNLNLIASQKVLSALHAYREQISIGNINRDYTLDEILLLNLVNAIRADLKMPGGGRLPPQSVRLYSPGPRRDGQVRLSQ